MTITHTFVSAIADGADATLVRPSNWNAVHTFADIGAVGYRVGGLLGSPNAATPNTKYDYSADLVVLRSTTDGTTVVRTNTGTLTNDTGVAGVTANGRDQAGAFSSSIWVHFYFIWNGTTLATLSSTVAPPTGPTLPTGYTHWAYCGAVRYNATPLLVRTYMVGSWMHYEARQNVVNAGTATVETSVDLSTFIPPLAYEVRLSVGKLGGTTTAGGLLNMTLALRAVSGANSRLYTYVVSITNNVAQACIGGDVVLPNITNVFFYILAQTSGTSPNTTIDCQGYKIMNGGE